MPRMCSYCGTPWKDDDTPPHPYEVCLEGQLEALGWAVKALCTAERNIREIRINILNRDREARTRLIRESS